MYGGGRFVSTFHSHIPSRRSRASGVAPKGGSNSSQPSNSLSPLERRYGEPLEIQEVNWLGRKVFFLQNGGQTLSSSTNPISIKDLVVVELRMPGGLCVVYAM